MIQSKYYLSLILVALFSTKAFAYVDPSSGYVLWQVLMGGVMGLLFFSKRIWNNLKKKKSLSPPRIDMESIDAH